MIVKAVLLILEMCIKKRLGHVLQRLELIIVVVVLSYFSIHTQSADLSPA